MRSLKLKEKMDAFVREALGLPNEFAVSAVKIEGGVDSMVQIELKGSFCDEGILGVVEDVDPEDSKSALVTLAGEAQRRSWGTVLDDEPKKGRRRGKGKKKGSSKDKRGGGRRISFDMDITTARVEDAKERLQKLSWQKKLTKDELARYEGLCKRVDVDTLPLGQKDKIITLYKDVGRRLTGGGQ